MSFSRYQGEKNKKGSKHGKGCILYHDGCSYTGDWVNDKQEGFGVFDWGDGNKYMGLFKNGKQEGYGVYIWPTGGRYEGFWKDDRMHGYGNDGVMFIGYWRNDHQCGIGHRLQPEKYWTGPNKTMERRRIIREKWNLSRELTYSKEVELYPNFEIHTRTNLFTDTTIVFSDQVFQILVSSGKSNKIQEPFCNTRTNSPISVSSDPDLNGISSLTLYCSLKSQDSLDENHTNEMIIEPKEKKRRISGSFSPNELQLTSPLT